MVKLLHTETFKGYVRLFFLAGKRVLDFTQKALNNEKGLTKLLRYIVDIQCVDMWTDISLNFA